MDTTMKYDLCVPESSTRAPTGHRARVAFSHSIGGRFTTRRAMVDVTAAFSEPWTISNNKAATETHMATRLPDPKLGLERTTLF